MEKCEHSKLTLIYGDGVVDAASYDGKVLFVHEKWAVVLSFIDGLKHDGWEIIDIYSMGWGEVYKFKRPLDD